MMTLGAQIDLTPEDEKTLDDLCCRWSAADHSAKRRYKRKPINWSILKKYVLIGDDSRLQRQLVPSFGDGTSTKVLL